MSLELIALLLFPSKLGQTISLLYFLSKEYYLSLRNNLNYDAKMKTDRREGGEGRVSDRRGEGGD